MRFKDESATTTRDTNARDIAMNNIVYIVGAVVIVLAILSFMGFR